jgi:hypothetical protein
VAGEWVPYDVCLPHKPEVLELVDRTGLPVDQVVGRLVLLWGWASLNSSDGTAKLSVRLLARLCGGDEEFWQHVQAVGWLVIDADAGTVAIPGWERRFSKSAKSRALHAVRADGARQRTTPCASAHSRPARRAPERRDRGDRNSSSSPGGAALGQEDAQPAGWDTLRAAWKAGKGRPWQLPTPPDKAADRLAEEGWFEKALTAIDRLPACRYFRDPVTLPQFVAAGFVDKILGGQFDNAREQSRGPARFDDRPPPQEWTGDDAAAFERTKRAMAEKLRAMESGVGSVDS